MKVKALRDKDTKEFIHIEMMGNKYLVFTSSIPKVQPESATMELMESMYPLKDCDFDNFNNLELVEFELFERNTIGQDIRNKLTSPNNLVQLLEEFFKENVAYATDERKVIAGFIKKEMAQTKESVDYLAKLL